MSLELQELVYVCLGNVHGIQRECEKISSEGSTSLGLESRADHVELAHILVIIEWCLKTTNS